MNGTIGAAQTPFEPMPVLSLDEQSLPRWP
jgi:hypothetical protein